MERWGQLRAGLSLYFNQSSSSSYLASFLIFDTLHLMAYTWLFFDADGTLFDFELAEKLALSSVLLDLGQPLSDETHQNYQRINQELWLAFEEGKVTQAEIKMKRFERWLESLHIQADVEKVSRDYLLYLSQQGPLFENALEIIQALSRKYKMLLLTNGLKEVQRPRFNASVLKPYMQDIIVSGEVGFAKPDPRIFDAAFSVAGNPNKNEVLMIGDSLSADIQGGINYGLDTCWYNPMKGGSSLPITYTIHDLRQLLEIL
jgi:2-haloacid dehalogenase